MPRRKQTKRTTVKDLRTILRLTHEHGLSVRAVSERLGISKTSVATYLLRAREAALGWPLPADCESDTALERALFRRVGRPPRDLSEPDWPLVAQELKRKGVTLTLLWQEYRTVHPDGYGYTCYVAAAFMLPTLRKSQERQRFPGSTPNIISGGRRAIRLSETPSVTATHVAEADLSG